MQLFFLAAKRELMTGSFGKMVSMVHQEFRFSPTFPVKKSLSTSITAMQPEVGKSNFHVETEKKEKP